MLIMLSTSYIDSEYELFTLYHSFNLVINMTLLYMKFFNTCEQDKFISKCTIND